MTKETFAQEIDAYSGTLYRVAYAILRNSEDCKDALQESVLKAWESRGSLRDETLFRTWLTRILIHTCYEMLRKRRRIVLVDEVPEHSSPPHDPTLRLVLETLPDKLRLPLILCYMEGLSYEQAAAAMRIPLSTLRSRIHRAKKQLRKEMEAE